MGVEAEPELVPPHDRARVRARGDDHWGNGAERYLFDEQGFVNGIHVKNVKTGETKDHFTGGVFVAIGHKPNTELFKGVLDMDAAGYLKTKGGAKGATTNNTVLADASNARPTCGVKVSLRARASRCTASCAFCSSSALQPPRLSAARTPLRY